MKINGKSYCIPELSFNSICELEAMGVSITSMDKHIMMTVRGFVALAMGGDIAKAGDEIQQHLMNGGSLDEIMPEITKAVNESGFFQAMGRNSKPQAAKATATR